MASSHPSEHFAQADSLLTGIIDNYRNSADATEMAEVVSMLEHAVRVARDREFRVQDSIKGALAWPPVWCTRLQLVMLCSGSTHEADVGPHLPHCCAELSHKVAGAEADAVYSEAREQHEQRMKQMKSSIGGVQQEVQQLNCDLR